MSTQPTNHDATFENLILEFNDGIARVTLNRPDKFNALNSALLEELIGAFSDIEDDPGVGAVVLTGSPNTKRPAFAAGADISEMATKDGLRLRELSRLGQTAFDLIEGLSKPVIAAVNGLALGGGCELALACHWRYAAAGASFGQPEINLGIIPSFGGTQRLARLVGRGRALEILLSGDPIDAAEAHRIGIVNRVLEPGQLIDAAEATARKIAGKAPVARESILEAVNRGADLDLAGAQAVESDLFGLVGTTEDVKEGMNAFLQKRTPTWKGR